MEKITDVFFNWQVLLLSFAAFAILGVIRSIGTKKQDGKAIGGFSQSKWFGLFLPLYPYILTLGFVFIPGVPLPESVTSTIAVKILYGVYAGWLSGFSFQLIKNLLEKVGVEFGKTEKSEPTPQQ